MCIIARMALLILPGTMSACAGDNGKAPELQHVILVVPHAACQQADPEYRQHPRNHYAQVSAPSIAVTADPRVVLRGVSLSNVTQVSIAAGSKRDQSGGTGEGQACSVPKRCIRRCLDVQCTRQTYLVKSWRRQLHMEARTSGPGGKAGLISNGTDVYSIVMDDAIRGCSVCNRGMGEPWELQIPLPACA
jgi:hypothetical protein